MYYTTWRVFLRPAATLSCLAVLLAANSALADDIAGGRGLGVRLDAPRTRTSRPPAVRDLLGRPVHLVDRAVDGDTLRLADGARIRLIGVDTPETKHPTKPVQCYGPEAAAFTAKNINDRYVVLEYGDEERDRYGRMLAYVARSDDSWPLNLELVRRGYGFAYTKYRFSREESFIAAENEARSAGRGLWGACPIDDKLLAEERSPKGGGKKRTSRSRRKRKK